MNKLFSFIVLNFLVILCYGQNVGIGTTNPTKGTLVIRGTVGAVSAMFGDNTTGVAIENSYPGIGLNSYYNGSRKAIHTGYGGLIGLNPNNGDLYLLSSGQSVTTDTDLGAGYRLLINKDGNIGIQGLATPAMPFSFNNVAGNKIALWGQLPTAHYGLGVQTGLLQMYAPSGADDIAFGFGSSTNFTETMRIKGSGNVGIGEQVPAFKLDINGRMRLQHDNTTTAGIWFDGSTSTLRSFIGTIDNDNLGIWGSGGAGWGIAMNVNSGNTGIATTTPTAKLDVNGSFRVRSSFPKKGSVMTSEDANGNASWADAVAFKASGRNTDALPNFPLNVWTKWWFETTPEYNVGFAYQFLNSQFVAAEDGIYHFNAQIHTSGYAEYLGIRLMRDRAGLVTDVSIHTKGPYNMENPPTLTDVIFNDACSIGTDLKLLVGDIIWVEFIYDSTYSNNPFPVSSSEDKTWFNGHLVSRL